MSEATYRIKPLEWEASRDSDWFTADTVFCSFHVQRVDDAWEWRYCIDEYHDEGSEQCESLEDGKQKAEAFYMKRLMPALEPIGTLPFSGYP